MKRFLLIIAACFPAIGLLAADVEPMPADTVITGTDRVTNGANISSRSISRSLLGTKILIRTGQASAWASPTSPVATGSTT